MNRPLWKNVCAALALTCAAGLGCGEDLSAPPMNVLLPDGGYEQNADAAIEDGGNILGWPDAESPEEDDAGWTVIGGEDASGGEEEDAAQGPDDAGAAETDSGTQEEDAGGTDPLAWVPACTTTPCPIVIEKFPYANDGSTVNGGTRFDKYSCAAGVSEAGPEEYYVFHVTQPGILIAGLTEPSKGDVDIHLLSALDSGSCLARSDKGISEHLEPGIYYLALDTYSSANNAGAYHLNVVFLSDNSTCALNVFDLDRVNSSEPLPMPATGKVVKEAHLVTTTDQSENGGKNWWPSSSTEYLSNHKARTQSLTGITYNRTETWAPAGEGGCEYGQGSTGAAVPDIAEAWYVCMYWKGVHRPKAGTKYLVVNPATGKAVVAAAGYETGPGEASHIGGAVEEIHHILGTKHLSTLTFGELKDQSLTYGEIECK